MNLLRKIAVLLMTGVSIKAVQLVDIQNVPAVGDPASAVVSFTVPANPVEFTCDVLVAGAGMGGIPAAMRAAQRGHSVCLTEESDWVGGQATAGGVPALDENKFIEIAGGTRSYYAFRNAIREEYRRRYTLSPAAQARAYFNPGSCYVSALCAEPRVELAVLRKMIESPQIRLLLRTQVFSLKRNNSQIESALAWQFDQHRVIRLRAKWYLDSTESGDLLPLAKVPYLVGSEARATTNEPHAATAANPACVQSFTYPFVVERRDASENNTIAALPDHDAVVKRQGFTLRMNYPKENGWKGDVQYDMYAEDAPIPNNMSPRGFFEWRRLTASKNFSGPNAPPEQALMNWPRQDYAEESILDREPLDLARILQRAKQTSLVFLRWLQVDQKHPELKLVRDAMGSSDGLSKLPYVRESRRLLAKGRVTEQDISDETQPGPRAKWFADSVGTGFYMVDIHPCGANERGRMAMPRPFQIPMATLEPQGVTNLLAAGKTLGVTHLTNGAFRLHPVEWNIGEAAGMMASLALESRRDVQSELAQAGVPLVWFDDLPVTDPSFAAIHTAAIRGFYPLGTNLHASPDAPLTRQEAAEIICARNHVNKIGIAATQEAVARGWMAVDHRNWFHADLPFQWPDWRQSGRTEPGPVRRREFAAAMVSGAVQ